MMSMTRSQARSFDSSPYVSGASILDGRASSIRSAVETLAAGQSTAATNWAGEAATAFATKVHSEKGKASRRAAEFAQAAEALRYAGQTIGRACSNALSTADGIELAGFDVDDQWNVSLSSAQMLSPGRGIAMVERPLLQAILNVRVNAISTADANAVAMLSRGDDNQGSSEQGDGSDTTSNGFTIGGEPDRTITYDDDFPWGSRAGQDTDEDRASWREWNLKANGAQMAWWLRDAANTYSHYLSNTGEPMELDLERASREDPSIRQNTDEQIAQALAAANEAVNDGYTNTTIHSPMTSSTAYPETENWQKAIGGYTTYSDSRVTVEGDTVTVEVTVTARDKYNFNRGASDIASGTPDDVNGRFEELGWARSFETFGTVTETYTWRVGEEPPAVGSGTGGGRGR